MIEHNKITGETKLPDVIHDENDDTIDQRRSRALAEDPVEDSHRPVGAILGHAGCDFNRDPFSDHLVGALVALLVARREAEANVKVIVVRISG